MKQKKGLKCEIFLDIAAQSHFKGSGVYPVDGGTSAASPVAAGAVAALRERFSNSVLSPAALKGTIQRTAIDIDNNGWDYDIGQKKRRT